MPLWQSVRLHSVCQKGGFRFTCSGAKQWLAHGRAHCMVESVLCAETASQGCAPHAVCAAPAQDDISQQVPKGGQAYERQDTLPVLSGAEAQLVIDDLVACGAKCRRELGNFRTDNRGKITGESVENSQSKARCCVCGAGLLGSKWTRLSSKAATCKGSVEGAARGHL